MDWIDKITDLVKNADDANKGWDRLLALCKRTRRSNLWDALPSPDTRKDVGDATRWLTSQIRRRSAPKPIRGLYLGLDTLNMRGGTGHNIELGATASCDPFSPDSDWTWNCEWYGTRHLIEGLFHLKNVYEQQKWRKIFGFADYALFLGYSGVILSQALAAVPVREPLIATWGFHDGDLFRLARRSTDDLERICQVI